MKNHHMRRQIQHLLETMPPEYVVHFLARIIDALPLSVSVMDGVDDFRSVIANKACQEIWRGSEETVLHRNEFDFAPVHIATKMRETNVKALETGRPLCLEESIPDEGPDARTFRKWKVPISDPSGRPRFLLIIAHDITAQKELQDKERTRSRQLQSIGLNAPGILYQFKRWPDGRFTFPYISERVTTAFGIDPEKVKEDGTPLIESVHPDDRHDFDLSIQRTIMTLNPWHWEGRMMTPQGVKYYRGASQPTPHADGSIVWDGILLDVTAEREAEEMVEAQQAQLVESSKLAALGELAGGVAHEINTPLNTIILATDMIGEQLDRGDLESARRSLARITETTSRISYIIRGMKRVCRDGSSDPFEAVCVHSLVDQTISLCQEKFNYTGIELTTDVDENLKVIGRPVQLSQVLLNLLSNAFDATEKLERRRIHISAHMVHDDIQIAVTDNGGPIPENVKAKMFKTFFTTKESGKGTGLGLSISKKIVEEHDGILELDRSSSLTRFVITLRSAVVDGREVPLEPLRKEA